MKRKHKLKTIQDVDQELTFILNGNRTVVDGTTIEKILFTLADAIELSIEGRGIKSFSLPPFRQFLLKFLPKGILSKNPEETKRIWSTDFPKEGLELESVVLKLRTAITAFRLHSGPFTKHVRLGLLEKTDWEKIHVKLAESLFQNIILKYEDRSRHPKDDEYVRGRERSQGDRVDFHNSKDKQLNTHPAAKKKWKNKKKGNRHFSEKRKNQGNKS